MKNGSDLLKFISLGLVAALVISALSYVLIAVRETGKGSRESAGESAAVLSDDATGDEDNENDADDGSDGGASSGASEEIPESETESETSPLLTETVSHDDSIEIVTVSQEELSRLSSEYDTAARGFGTEGDKDEYNRPVQVNDFITGLGDLSAHVKCYCADTETKKVSFTFQAGTETGHTEQVLDILNNYNVKSTFYISHFYAVNNPSIVKRMISDGHELGNHSYTCPDSGIATMDLEDQMSDAINMQNYVKQAFGYNMTKYNYNSSMWSPASIALMSEMGYEICFFSVNYDDFDENADYDADVILEMLEASLHNGCVYCFHMTNEITVKVLPALIEYCKDQGYTVTQMP